MADGLTETISKLKSEIEHKVADIKSQPAWTQIEKLCRALGTIEELAVVPRTSLVELFGIEDGAGKNVRIKQGEFYGLEPLDAAKRFLKRKGEAASLDEIMNAIQTGGITVPSRDSLRLSLSRSTWDVAKVSDDSYGLLEFYPHVKRGGKKKGTTAVSEAATPVGSIPVEVEDNDDEKPTGT